MGRHPFKGRPYKRRQDLRGFTFKHDKSSYFVRYRVTDDLVAITRIWHGKEERR
ncbi:MAG: type II toxin-antitoxin system RelE/ParE family toxin [Hyphomonadaceae bacterium]|nr:type II toxin-antitoxin system RelE/ParE family toxin [Hyphomonadaceae bacterium]